MANAAARKAARQRNDCKRMGIKRRVNLPGVHSAKLIANVNHFRRQSLTARHQPAHDGLTASTIWRAIRRRLANDRRCTIRVTRRATIGTEAAIFGSTIWFVIAFQRIFHHVQTEPRDGIASGFGPVLGFATN